MDGFPERRQNANGRRSGGDAWLPRGKELWGALALLVALIGVVFKVYAQSLDYPQVKQDVEDLKKAVPTILYLTCRDHANAYPSERLPALCSMAISSGPK